MQSGDLLSYNNLLLSLLRLAPSQLYTDAATTLRMPSVRSLGPLTIEQMAGVIAEGDPNIAPTLLWNMAGVSDKRDLPHPSQVSGYKACCPVRRIQGINGRQDGWKNVCIFSTVAYNAHRLQQNRFIIVNSAFFFNKDGLQDFAACL